MNYDLKTTQTVLRERKTKKKFNFLFQKLREAAAATRPTTPSRPPHGNKFVLDGGREAAQLGGIHAEGSVNTCEEGVGGGEGKGGELEGRGVVQKTVGPRTLDRNRKDAPIPASKAGAQGSAQRRGGGN